MTDSSSSLSKRTLVIFSGNEFVPPSTLISELCCSNFLSIFTVVAPSYISVGVVDSVSVGCNVSMSTLFTLPCDNSCILFSTSSNFFSGFISICSCKDSLLSPRTLVTLSCIVVVEVVDSLSLSPS